jgi:hypothetical protein
MTAALTVKSTPSRPERVLVTLESLPQDLALHIIGHLGAVELACLACTSRRFAMPIPGAVLAGEIAVGNSGAVQTSPCDAIRPRTGVETTETRSLVEEAACRWLTACSLYARAQVPHRGTERWISLMHEAEQLRLPPVFCRFCPDGFAVGEQGRLVTATRWMDQAAACSTVMRSGRHFGQFSLVEGGFMMLGVVRPSWDAVSELHAHEQGHHVFYHTGSGQRFLGKRKGKRKWPGMARAAGEGDCIGLMLDFDEGSVTVFKNNVQLGVMVASGLHGDYCWAVGIATPGYTVRLQSLPAIGFRPGGRLLQTLSNS